MLVEVENELSRQQDEDEDAAHPFESVDAQVFDIQALLLVKAIAMFDSSAQAPIIINLLGRALGSDGDVREQYQSAFFEVIFGDEHPELLTSLRDANGEPPHFDLGQAGASGVMESGLKGGLPEHAVDQVSEMLRLPTLQARIVDFHQPLQMSGGDNKFIRLQKSKQFLRQGHRCDRPHPNPSQTAFFDPEIPSGSYESTVGSPDSG